MRRVYIDVSNMIFNPYMTGIPRVVLNVVRELNILQPELCILIIHDKVRQDFQIVPISEFIACKTGRLPWSRMEKVLLETGHYDLSTMEPGSILLDIDVSWWTDLPRNLLYKKLQAIGIKVVPFVHDIIHVTHPQYVYDDSLYPFLRYLGAVLLHADQVIVTTEATKNEIEALAQQLSLGQMNVHIARLGSDFKSCSDVEAKPAPAVVAALGGRKYVLCVSTLEPRKNQAYLLDAFEQGLYDEDLCLVLVGKVGWEIEPLHRRILSSCQYGQQLFFFEGVDDGTLDWLYRNAWLVAFPSYVEGFGLSIVEALERGIPVLTSDVPVLREVGTDFCLYFNPYDERTFVSLVKNLLADEGQYKALQEHVLEFPHFTWRDTAIKILEALESQTIAAQDATASELTAEEFYCTLDEMGGRRTRRMLDDLYSFCKSHSRIFIYGAGHYGEIIKQCLDRAGYVAEGFLVTQGSGSFCGLPVWEATQRLASIEDMQQAKIGIILALQNKFHKEVLDVLRPFHPECLRFPPYAIDILR